MEEWGKRVVLSGGREGWEGMGGGREGWEGMGGGRE